MQRNICHLECWYKSKHKTNPVYVTYKRAKGRLPPFPFDDSLPAFVVCPTFQLISLLFDLPRSAAAAAEAKTLSSSSLKEAKYFPDSRRVDGRATCAAFRRKNGKIALKNDRAKNWNETLAVVTPPNKIIVARNVSAISC